MNKIYKYIFVLAFLWSSPIMAQEIEGTTFVMDNSLRQATAVTQVANPVGGMEVTSLSLESGYSRQFEWKYFDRIFFAGAFRYKQFYFALGLSQMGETDYYNEHNLRLSLGYQYDSLLLGLTVTEMQTAFDFPFNNLDLLSYGFGISYRTDLIIGSLSIDNINRPKWYLYAVPLPQKVTLIVDLKANDGISFVGRSLFTEDQKPSLALSQFINLADQSSVFVGVSSEPLTYGGGIRLKIREHSFTYTTDYHSVLGFSHRIKFCYNLSLAKKEGR